MRERERNDETQRSRVTVIFRAIRRIPNAARSQLPKDRAVSALGILKYRGLLSRSG